MSVREEQMRSPIATESSSCVRTGSWRTLRPEIDLQKCSRCYTCWKYCPEVAIRIADDSPDIDYVYCKGCGICANECPKKCIVMTREELGSYEEGH